MFLHWLLINPIHRIILLESEQNPLFQIPPCRHPPFPIRKFPYIRPNDDIADFSGPLALF